MPLLWVRKLKETSARITKWKEQLAAYSFDIKHIKGSDNVVADCLSRNVGSSENDANKEKGQNGEDLSSIYFTARCLNEGSDSESVRLIVSQPLEVAATNPTAGSAQMAPNGNTEVHDSNQRIPRVETIINNKRNQIVLEEGVGSTVTSQAHRYGPIMKTTVKVGPSSTREDLVNILNQVAARGKLYHLYAGNARLVTTFERLWEQRKLNSAVRWEICTKQVETVEDKAEQLEALRTYHEGKTNHRGISETLKHLQRSYYWLNMSKSIEEFIGKCLVCEKGKYDRRPFEVPQMLTPTPMEAGEVLEVDIFQIDRQKYLTSVDRFTKLASAWPLSTKSAEEVKETLLYQFSVRDTPKMVVCDRGKEFRNRKVEHMLRTLGIHLHFITTGHPRSHGMIERFHNTLMEHLSLFKISREISGREAVARAVLAYNSSIHSATDATPFEMSSGKKEAAVVHHQLEQQKTSRVQKFNREHAEDLSLALQVGDIAYVRNHYRRRKSDVRYIGPFIIMELLERGRVRLQPQANTKGGSIVRHITEIKRVRR